MHLSYRRSLYTYRQVLCIYYMILCSEIDEYVGDKWNKMTTNRGSSYSLALGDSCFCIVSATMRLWILPVAVLGMTSVK